MAITNYTDFDLVIYGDTCAACMGAAAFARKWPQYKVAVVLPHEHVGGQIANVGLTATDYGRAGSGLIGTGIVSQLWERNATAWETDVETNRFEAHFFEYLMLELMLENENLAIYPNRTLDKVTKAGASITSATFLDSPNMNTPATAWVTATSYVVADLVTESGNYYRCAVAHSSGTFATDLSAGKWVLVNHSVFTAPFFSGADQEGDFNDYAGVPVLIGRNSQAQYGEYLAGFGKNLVSSGISALDEFGNLLPGVEEYPALAIGDADGACQTMALRPDHVLRANGVTRPYYQPDNYQDLIDNKEMTVLFARVGASETFHVPSSTIAGQFNEILDQLWPQSGSDWLNASPYERGYGPDMEYPGSLWQKYWGQCNTFMWWRANEDGTASAKGTAGNPPAPQTLRVSMAKWGLPPGEFRDNHYSPRHLYVRQPKLPVGYYVMRQDDCQVDDLDPDFPPGDYPATYSIYKIDPAGIGSLKMDTHAKRWLRDPLTNLILYDIGSADNDSPPANGTRFNADGNETNAVLQYQISARSLLPVATDVSNLIFMHALSASEVVWRSMRTDITLMNCAVAAAYIVGFALENSWTLKQVVDSHYADVLAALIDDGQALYRQDGRVNAMATLTFTTNDIVDTETVTIGGLGAAAGTVVTCGVEFSKGASADETVANLLAFLQGSADGNISQCLYQSPTATSILATYKVGGTTGNSFKVADTINGAAWSGATLAGGSN